MKKITPSFSEAEKIQMLALKGVGATVVSRLEQIGFSTLQELKDVNPLVVTKQISLMMGSSCWHNSPLAKNAIGAIVNLAKTANVKTPNLKTQAAMRDADAWVASMRSKQ
jgi:hypothetical protein